MHKDRALDVLGKYINIGYENEGYENELSNILRGDVEFSSHRFLYKIQGTEKVLALLKEWMLKNCKTHAYSSYYKTKDYSIKSSLQPCILLVGESKSDFLSILTIKMRRGKIQEIIGLDPKEYSPTRGELII